MRARWMVAAFGLVAITLPVVTASAARAESEGPRAVSVDILGGDHFVHPGLLANDFRFPDDPIVIARGGTITFHNKTADAHTISLVAAADVPKTTAQVDNCGLCNSINGVYPLSQGAGLPNGVQIDNGVAGDDPAQPGDANAQDQGAIATISPSLLPFPLPVLIEDFDTPSHTNRTGPDTVGDSTLVDTAGPNAFGFASQRTIVVTAAPGLYHYFCTIHAWMQGTIRVVAGRGERS
jgi:plastocyanin